MNHYPESIPALIAKADQSLEILLSRLNHPNCLTLGELYQQAPNGKVYRQSHLFEELGYMPNTKSGENNRTNNEIQGLYVFGECVDGKVVPVYIGISRAVFRRLRQHGWGKLHNEATFAYRMAATDLKHKTGRTTLASTEIEKQQKIIKTYKVAILQEEHDYDMYFMEVYFAGKLKTPWNSFRTH
jgi:predicted GIY-YIG superfamily endonuclease